MYLIQNGNRMKNSLDNIRQIYCEIGAYENTDKMPPKLKIIHILKAIQDGGMSTSLDDSYKGHIAGVAREIYFDCAPDFRDKDNFIQWIYEQVS
jgi:hypothetical protein